jgi:hypothetical protein
MFRKKQKHRFMEIYQLIYENPKQAASELKIFKKESNTPARGCSVELLLLHPTNRANTRND